MAKVFIEESTLTKIGNAIRSKTGKTELIDPSVMDVEITSITTGGGGIPEEALTFTGDCSNKFLNGAWDWYIDVLGPQLKTKDVTTTSSMFKASNIEEVPFEINFDPNAEYHNIDSMFANATNLEVVPRLNGCKVNDMSEMFNGCHNLREVPDWFVNQIDWSYVEAMNSYTEGGHADKLFRYCCSLRKYPLEIVKHANKKCSYLYCYFYNMAANCYSLDDLNNIPLSGFVATWNSNAFNNSVGHCSRLSGFTFELQPDGTPYVMSWKSQTIDFTTYTGYAQLGDFITSYNSGITYHKKVTDDASYQALKNDPDWYTDNVAYSRYNHDSAVATINSLPDTSAYIASSGGTNTIKFKGAAGSATDGGAIQNLTAEEIAVATAKGWTVTLS